MTALFDPRSFGLFDGLRCRYFPAQANHLDAHATLFHHLPGEDLRRLSEALASVTVGTAPLPFTIGRTLFLGRGVAFALEAPGLVAIRDGIARTWRDRLTAQDRQPYRAHVTIQNKVAGEVARDTQARLDALLPITGTISGLALWHYRGGPWDEAGRFPFDLRAPERPSHEEAAP